MSAIADLFHKTRMAPKHTVPALYHRQPVLVMDAEAASAQGYRKFTAPYRESETWMLEIEERQLDYGGIPHCRVKQSESVRENGKTVSITGFTLWRK